eukprot:1295204-Amphidinium_carterae.1
MPSDSTHRRVSYVLLTLPQHNSAHSAWFLHPSHRWSSECISLSPTISRTSKVILLTPRGNIINSTSRRNPTAEVHVV